MANVFDQFDPPKTGNVFDQFDEQPNVAIDMAASLAAGVPRGLAETAMFPVTLSRTVEGAGDWLFNKGEDAVRGLIGAEPMTDEARAARDAEIENMRGGRINDVLYGLQDKAREGMDSVLYEPQTTAGEFTGAIGEFTGPGGLPSKAARHAPGAVQKAYEYGSDFVGNVLMPALASEGAGQATEGTWAETPARILGAIFGNAVPAATRAYNAPEAIVRRATPEMTDAEWQKAADLQASPTGVRVTGPEAIAQVKDGGTALTQVQRYVEGSVDGQQRMAPFFAERPGQVDTAVNDVLDTIAPQPADPFDIGRKAAAAGEKVIDKTRQDINAQTEPLYKAAEPQTVSGANLADPAFQVGLKKLREDPVLGPKFAQYPDDSVAVIDAVTKDMLEQGEAMKNTASPTYGPHKGAVTTGSAVEARNAATRSSPEYAQAVATQDQLRDTVLNPLEEGPVGKVKAAGDTAAAGNAILPKNPMPGSGAATGDAVSKLAAEDPETIAALIRQQLANRYSTAATETQTGSKEFSGAKFHKDVAGNEARQEVLDAVLAALPGGPTQKAADVLEILQTTGRRYPQNSATSFNDSIADDISAMNAPGMVASTATGGFFNWPVMVTDAAKRAGHRRSVGSLADMFVSPDSVQLIRNAQNRGLNINAGEALIRTLLQGGVIQD